jgi:hypothetical protein
VSGPFLFAFPPFEFGPFDKQPEENIQLHHAREIDKTKSEESRDAAREHLPDRGDPHGR